MTDMDATKKREVIEGFLDHIDAMTVRINHLHQRLSALEAAYPPAPAPVMSDETVEAISDALTDWGMVRMTPSPAPTPETDTVTVSKAVWDTTQERVKNAINALYDIQMMRGGDPSAFKQAAISIVNDAIQQDIEFEAALGA